MARNIRENKRALSLYVTGGKYELQKLQFLATERMCAIDSDVPVGYILKHIEAAFSEVCDSDEWLATYLVKTLRRTFLAYANTPDPTPHQ